MGARRETGRREEEQFEAQPVRRAVNVFIGGRGGLPAEPHIRELLGSWLEPYYAQGRIPEPQAGPTLADIIQWKDSEVFVVEAALKVALNAVERADACRDLARGEVSTRSLRW